MDKTKLKFNLRQMQPTDSKSVNDLISGFDGDMLTSFQVDAYEAIVSGTKYETQGVVAEVEGPDPLAGMGTLRFSKVQFNGRVLPLAFLDGLKVAPNFRRQGLGFQIANWRVQKARERFGDECVIGTGMEVGNLASRATAKKWCREFIDLAAEIFIQPNHTKEPKASDEVIVRELEENEYKQFADEQNNFYKDYNFYEHGNADSIKAALEVNPGGKKPYRYYVAVDTQGNLLAGAQTWARGMTKFDKLINPPPPFRIINKVFHLLPADYIIRDVSVSGIWYRPGLVEIGSYLFEMIRWLRRDVGSAFVIGFDPNDPAKEILRLKPWHQPRPKIRYAVHGPEPIDRSRLLYISGRV
jgi:predicted N-acetyltransferase YhbS